MGISVSTDNENIHDLNGRSASALHLVIAFTHVSERSTRNSVQRTGSSFGDVPRRQKFTFVSNLMDKRTKKSLVIFLMADFPAVGLKKGFHKFPNG